MRVRTGNPFMDQHYLRNPDFSMRVYEFITHAGTNPHDVAVAIENVVPELKIYGRGATLRQRRYDQVTRTWHEEAVQMPVGPETYVNGVVWTSWHEPMQDIEPCLHVAFGLYDTPCSDTTCNAGHITHGLTYQRAPSLEAWQLDAIKEEVGEHNKYRLGVNAELDRDILSGLGFLPLDAPLKGEDVGLERIYKALDYLAGTSEKTFVYKAMELQRLGYELDVEMVQMLVQAHRLELEAIS